MRFFRIRKSPPRPGAGAALPAFRLPAALRQAVPADIAKDCRKQRPIPEGSVDAERAEARSITEGPVPCAGCGRGPEAPFMEPDRVQPRAGRGENDIGNRILPCRPCNGRKSARLTMKGQIDENRKSAWAKEETLANRARDLARELHQDIRCRRRRPAATGDLFDCGRKP